MTWRLAVLSCAEQLTFGTGSGRYVVAPQSCSGTMLKATGIRVVGNAGLIVFDVVDS